MYSTQDFANGNIVQCPSEGLQSASAGNSQSNGASSNGDNWDLSDNPDPWASSAGDCIDSTNQVNGDNVHVDTCRHCDGPHMSSKCPTLQVSGRDSSKTCHKCHEPGHMSFECRSGGGERRGDRRPQDDGCFKCGEKGHIARLCQASNRSYENDRPRGGDRSFGNDRPRGGDRSFENDRPRGGDRSYGGPPVRCENCGGRGHTEDECPSPKENGDSGYESRNSQRSGARQETEVTCYRCSETGHNGYNCPKRVGADTDRDAQSGPYDHVVTTSEEEAVNRNDTGVNFERYKNIAVKVMNSSGEETNDWEYKKLISFEGTKLNANLKANIARMKYKEPTPVQKYAIPIVSEGQDLIACAQTGSGKTAAFVLPIINSLIESNLQAPRGRPQRPYVLILTPTRELTEQITVDAKQFSLRTGIEVKECYGGTVISTQMRNIQEGCHVLVGNAGRVMDFLNRDVFNLSELRYIVLDEADRMLDMGFSGIVGEILNHHSRNRQNTIQTVMFSATFAKEVEDLARRYLRPNFLRLDVGVTGTVNSDVRQSLEVCKDFAHKKESLYKIIKNELETIPGTKILVFAETKRTTDTLASFLSLMKIKATSMHGDRLQEQRAKALRDFQRSDCPVLVATSVAARGLDITGVKHVINFDLPKEIAEYVHRVGRTGRVGNEGRATSFYEPNRDYHLMNALIQCFMDGGQTAPSFEPRNS